MMKKIGLWILGIFAVLLTAITLLGNLPTPFDPPVPPEEQVVGAQTADDAKSAFDIAFPETNEPANNPTTQAKADLGHVLFFDPILSGADDVSCASCHHPDLGFSDGQAVSDAAGRNVPTLYEVAYRSALYMDGRSDTLEDQVVDVLTNRTEMNADIDEMVAELQAIDEYVEMFADAFPDAAEPISLETVSQAIAAFERGIVAHNSPYDQFAAGDTTALTASQRRGLNLLRSGATGCYSCHFAPTFNNDDFAVIGVPDADGQITDLGVAAISENEADRGAFAVPTLRNIALTAPYMHAGQFETLEEVLDFYIAGGGEGHGLEIENQSFFVSPLTLTDSDRQDLLNFLYALTDESTLVEIPSEVPSGLRVVKTKSNAARAAANRVNLGSAVVSEEDRPAMVLTVSPGMDVQAVFDRAIAGDIIKIEYGTYNTGIITDVQDLTVRGEPNAAGDYPTFDGQFEFTDGISATGDNFVVEKMTFRNYTANGVKVDGATGIVMRDLEVHDTGIYGTYPVHCTDVLIERVEVSGAADAGVYAGQCKNVIVRDTIAYDNVLGIEVENSVNAEVYDNHVYNNSFGIFIPLLPNIASKVSYDTKVYNNIVENNNHPNFAPDGFAAALAPPGGGIVILGSDNAQIYGNTITGNQTAGIAVFATSSFFEEVDVHPNPENVRIYNNTYADNGLAPDKVITDLGLPGADVLWDASAWNVTLDDEAESFPPLPPSWLPDFARKAYWKILTFAINNLL